MLDKLKKDVIVYIYDKAENKILIKNVDSFVFNCSYWKYCHLLTTDDEKQYIIDPIKTRQFDVYETDGGQYLISTEPNDLSLELIVDKQEFVKQVEKYDYWIDYLRKEM